jgi:heptosyltransferase I
LISLKPDSRILFIRASAVGDVLNTLPSLEALRKAYPDAFIAYLADERSIELVANHPALNRTHFFPRKRWLSFFRKPTQWRHLVSEIASFISELRGEDYDISVDLQRNLKGGILGLFAGAKTRVGLARPFAKEGNQLFTHVQVKPQPEAVHFAEHFLEVVRHLGAAEDGTVFRLPEAPESIARVEKFLKEKGLDNYAVIHPGTSAYGKLKRWPSEHFAALAQRLGKELGLKSVIAWGPGEGPLAEGIVGASEDQALLSFETRSLLDLVELIRRAKLFVGCDSGPMHLSGAVGTPCVALFGPKDPVIYGPYRHPLCRIVQPPGGMGPTEGIPVESVFDAAVSVLKESGQDLEPKKTVEPPRHQGHHADHP